MRFLFSLLIMFSTATIAEAQSCWLSHPEPDDSSQVWFRRMFIDRDVERAWLNVATTGFVKIYVNGMSVTTSAFEPMREQGDNLQKTVSIDVSAFMRPDTNVIAVCYSPAERIADRRQVAVSFFGVKRGGERFSAESDASWLCRKAPSSLNTDGGENIDGTADTHEWNGDHIDLALWRPSEESTATNIFHAQQTETHIPSYRVVRIHRPRYFDIQGDSVVYDFGEGFSGWVRVTLRKAKRGERISVGATNYVCNGTTDEQICPRFAISHHRRVPVSGDNRFRREQIVKIEGLEIQPSQTPTDRHF